MTNNNEKSIDATKSKLNIKWIRYFPFYLLIFSSFNGIGQKQIKPLTFNHLTQAEGLSQSINAYIFHDSHGFVWISSIDGLNRFDGVRVKTYREVLGDSSSLRGKNIYSNFFEDENNDIWFTTLKGLHVYRRNTDDFKFISVVDPNGNPIEERMKLIHLDVNGRLWIKTANHLYLYDLQLRSVVFETKASGIEGVVYSIDDSSSFLLFTHYRGLQAGFFIYEINIPTNEVKEETFLTDSRYGTVYSVCPLNEKEYWIGTSSGLIYFDKNLEKSPDFYQTLEGKRIGKIRSILPTGDNNIFLASEIGLLKFNISTRNLVDHFENENLKPQSLAQNEIHDLYLDHQENLWISLWGRGVDFTNLGKSKFSILSLTQNCNEEGKDVFEPGSLIEDRQNRKWIGSNKHGLMVLDKDNQLIPDLCNGSIGVKQLFLDNNGNVWKVNWDKSISIFEVESGRSFELKLNAFKSNSIGKISQLHDGRMLFTGYSIPGIYEILSSRNRSYGVEKLETSQISDIAYDRIFQSSNGKVLISHNNESISLFDYRNKLFTHDTTININAEVKAFLEDEQGIIWLGSTAGLVRLDMKSMDWKIYSEKNGLSSPYVYGILPDRQNQIWLSTNSGIYSFNKGSETFRNFNLYQGLQGYEFNSNSFLKTHNEEFWFGGLNGFNIFRSSEIVNLPDNSRLNIIDIEVNDEEYVVNRNLNEIDSLKLSYSQNTFSFTFVSSEYSNPNTNKVRFQLMRKNGEPYDKNWIKKPNLQAVARYPKVGPGEYNLSVQSSNSDGIWGKEIKTIWIKINPPIWLEPWFIALCIVLFGLIVWFSISVYLQNKLRLKNLTIREQRLELDRQETLQKERKRIARDMHDDLGTGLTQIRQAAVYAKKVDNSTKIDPYLLKMEDLAVGLIENMQGIIWAMDGDQSSLEELVAYIRRYVAELMEETGIDCEIKADEEWPEKTVATEVKRSIFLAIKEASHNIIKHANANKVWVRFEWAQSLQIQIEDNGNGVQDSSWKSDGNGLQNMRGRMVEVGGNFYLETPENGGYRLTFVIPIKDNE